MTDIAETIARVRELDAAATKGPWFPGHNPDYREPLDYIAEAYSCGPPGKVHLTCVPFGDKPIDDEALFTAITGNGPTSEQNAALIAHYRTAAPLLAAECERLRACMAKAGLAAFMRDGSPEAVAEHLRSVIDSYEKPVAECERLRERVRVLEKALRPFQFRDTHFIGCRRAGFGGEPHNDHDWSNGREPATACSTHCWAARAALKGTP